MVATSYSNGHEVYYDEHVWRYVDNDKELKEDRPCNKCGRETRKVKLCVPNHNSGRTSVHVDACIARLVQELNNFGVQTLGTCCGHGKTKPALLIMYKGKKIDLLEK